MRRRRSGGTGVLRYAHAPCRTRTRGCGNGQTADPSRSSRSSCGRRDRSPRRTTAEPEPESRRSRSTQTTSRHCDTTAYTSVVPLPSTLVLRTSSWFRQITARPGSGGRGTGVQPAAYTLDGIDAPICQDSRSRSQVCGLACSVVCHHALKDLAGENAFETADDLPFGPPFSGASFDVVEGW